jgi:hypothetical protein
MTHHLPALAHRAAQASAAVRSSRAQQRAADLAPIVTELRTGGATSLRSLAVALTRAGIAAPRGTVWTASAVKRDLDRMKANQQLSISYQY